MSLKTLYEDVPSDAQHYFLNYGRDTFFRDTTAHYDPIFFPLFSAAFGPTFAASAAGQLAIGLTSAIATTGLTQGIIIR